MDSILTSEGFSIEDENATWDDFIPEDKRLSSIRSYVYMKVKLLFDPPLSSSVMESMNRMINEFEWRLNVAAEPTQSNEEEVNQNGQ